MIYFESSPGVVTEVPTNLNGSNDNVFASTNCAPQVEGSVRSRSLHRTSGSGLRGQFAQSDWNRWLWNAQQRSDWIRWLWNTQQWNRWLWNTQQRSE